MADARRLARIEKAIAVEIAQSLITRSKDPRAATIISVTGVKISPDLSHAKISYSVLGDEAQKRTTQRMFEASRGFYQTLIAKRLDTRVTPHIVFQFDASLERQQHIASLIDDAIAADRDAALLRGTSDEESNGGEEE